jgi:glucokinase
LTYTKKYTMNIYALGIDLGGTKIAAAIVDSYGNFTHYALESTPALEGADSIFSAVINISSTIFCAAKSDDISISAIGIGTGGVVNHDHGEISFASDTLYGWTGFPLADKLGEIFNLPVSADNDVNVMAIAEMQFGVGREYREALFVSVGTGVGGAIVRDGHLWRGSSWTAGEIGHLVIDWDGKRQCNCGLYGHLDAYASGPAMAKRYAQRKGLSNLIDMEEIVQQAINGEADAIEVIREGAQILGLALGGLLEVLDPQALIIGGGIAEIGPLWWQPLESALRSSPLPGPASIILRKARLGTYAGVIGAGWMALSEHARLLHSKSRSRLG